MSLGGPARHGGREGAHRRETSTPGPASTWAASSRSWAAVADATALFVALAGTAAAAVVITGDDVADGSLTGADLAPRSIGVREVKHVAAGLQTTGADVIVGPSFKTLAKLTVPAGAFLVHANATVTGSSSATTVADCRLQAPDATVLETVRNVLVATAPKSPVSFSRVVATTGGSFELQCQRVGAFTNFTAQAISLNAVRLSGAGTRH